MDAYKVAVLAEEYEAARIIWVAHSMMNCPIDPIEATRSMAHIVQFATKEFVVREDR